MTELHGPFKLFHSVGATVDDEVLDQADIVNEHAQKKDERQEELTDELSDLPEETRDNPPLFSFATPEPQLSTTFNLEVRETGLYRVSYEMLRDAGLDLVGVPASKIALFNAGEEVPIHVESGDYFGEGAFIEFYGEALDTIYTDTNIYTLQVLDVKADRIKDKSAAPAKIAEPLSSYFEKTEL